MSDPVILSACRTAIGTFGGALKDIPAPDLGALVVREALRRAGVAPDAVDEIIMGCILQAGLGMNPARQVSIKAGLPETVPAHTVNKVCGSGLKAVMLAAQAIKAGDASLVVAGGIESMSRAPFLLPGARWGERLGHGKVLDHMIHEGLTDAFHDIHMGITAENLAERYGIRREEQDAFAAREPGSGGRGDPRGALQGRDRARAPARRRRASRSPSRSDEHPRADATRESLAKLKPAFKKDGTVTAGNASGLNDGAAAVVVASAARAAALGAQAAGPHRRLRLRGRGSRR